jgi:hypothetical protein
MKKFEKNAGDNGGTSNISAEEVSDILGIEPSVKEPAIVVEPVKEVKVEPVKEVKIEPVKEVKVEPVKEIKVEPVKEVEPAKEVVVEPVKEPPPTKKELELLETISKLQKKIDIFEPTLKDKVEPVKREPIKSLEERIQVEETDVVDFLSGDMARSIPATKKLIKYMHDFTVASVFSIMDHVEEVKVYARDTKKAFYDKYPDLKEYPEIVKVIGDKINQENPNKRPDELLEAIGEACGNYITKIKGVVKPAIISKGGEGPAAKITPAPSPKLTDQQKEMADLIE